MFAVAFTIILLSCSTIQVESTPLSVKHADFVKPLASKDEVEESVKTLIGLCQTSSNAASHVIDTLYDKLDIYKTIEIDNTPEMVNDELATFLAALDRIKNDNNSTDITSCLEGAEENLKKIAEDGIEEDAECVDTSNDVGLFLLNSTLSSIADNLRTVTDLEKELDLCDASDQNCIDSVAQTAGACSRYPALIEHQAKLISDSIEHVCVLFASCGTRAYYQVQDQSTQVLDNVLSCIDNL